MNTVYILAAEAVNDMGKVIEIDNIAGIVSVNLDGGRVLEYRWQKPLFKPYIKTLCTPKGVNVLLDSPEDHIHHHGLMFAVNADGVNFWEESADTGRQSQKNVSVMVSEDWNGGDEFVFDPNEIIELRAEAWKKDHKMPKLPGIKKA